MNHPLPAATVSAFFHLGLDLVGHLLLSHTAIHPFRLVMAVMTGDVKSIASSTNRASLITFLASEPTCPTTIETPDCAFFWAVERVHIQSRKPEDLEG
jgi:hypothetical protein